MTEPEFTVHLIGSRLLAHRCDFQSLRAHAVLQTCPQGHDGGVEGGVLLAQTPLPHHVQNQTSSINANLENEKAEREGI